MLATVAGFLLSKPIISKMGVKKTVDLGLLGAAFTAAVRCAVPANMGVYFIVGLIGSFVQIAADVSLRCASGNGSRL